MKRASARLRTAGAGSALTRRRVLGAGSAFAALTALAGCDRLVGVVPGIGTPLPDTIELPGLAGVDSAFHLLARCGFGARPGEPERVRRMGLDVWIDRQLDPATIDDTACDWRVAGCESVFDEPMDLRSVEPEVVDRDLVRHHLLRAAHSERRLLEVMVGFWSDHFSIQLQKRGCRETKPWDDREVVRRHALGPFRDLVAASARSPAMLRYLDNAENRSERPGDRPNENYARELLELHTLGVHGGYTQHDVMEAARCLSGWTLDDEPGLGHAGREVRRMFAGSASEPWARADVVFRPSWHDDGAKVVLGVEIPAGGGPRDLDHLVDIACNHPSTARHLATKLCRRLVADDPPSSVVESAARRFTETRGDVRAVVRHIVVSSEFAASQGAKTKRPFEFVVSALRALGSESRATPEEIGFLERLGHAPFQYPTPDGYPEEPAPWMGTLLWRWNFAVALVGNRLGATRTDVADVARRCGLDPATSSPAGLAPLLFGRAATGEERAAIDAYAARTGGAPADRRAEAVALLLCAPAFQVT